MEIGLKIKRLRLALNLTQEELADRTELSKSFISQVERDLTSPSIATLIDILQALGTDLKEFFGDETDSQIVFHDADYFEKYYEELKNKTEWMDHTECPEESDGADPCDASAGRKDLSG